MRTRRRPPLFALPHVALALVAVVLAVVPAEARGQDAWAAVSPEGEGFTVRMPAAPSATAQPQLREGELKAEGRRYEAAGGDGATYLVLSLKDADGAHERLVDKGVTMRFQRASPYLDAVAELAWDAILRPEAERRLAWWKRKTGASLSFVREFELAGKPAREYLLAAGKTRGPVYLCADGPRFYVVAAFGPEARAASFKQFVESFALGDAESLRLAAGAKIETGVAAGVGGVGPGRGGYTGGGGGGFGGYGGGGPGVVDYSRTFRGAEVSRKARIKSKPEPGYTDAARKFDVRGVVRVRAVLASSGAVERVAVIRGLPHGLTQSAVAAARKIKFEPAEKDGRRVSQYVTLDYNFQIY